MPVSRLSFARALFAASLATVVAAACGTSTSDPSATPNENDLTKDAEAGANTSSDGATVENDGSLIDYDGGRPPPKVITVKGGSFYDGATKWHPIGVNYNYPYYSQPFYGHSQWDWVTLWDAPEFPDIHAEQEIEADFTLMEKKKINEIRLFIPQTFPAKLADPTITPTPDRSYCKRLNTLFDLAGKHGIHVTMLFPFNRNGTGGTFGVAASQEKADLLMAYPVKVIDACGLAYRSELLGYLVDGEGEVESPSEPKFWGRGQDVAVGLWNEWLVERYGSVAKAEARLGESLPRECVNVEKDAKGNAVTTGCPDVEAWDNGCKAHGTRACPPRFDPNGSEASKWGPDSNAKRAFVRFTDWVMNKRFQRIREILHAHDPYHLLGQDSILQESYCSPAIFLRREQTKYLDYSGVHVYHHQYTKGTWNKATYGTSDAFVKLKATSEAIAWMNPERRPIVIGEVGVSVLPCETPVGGADIPFCIEGNAADRESVQKAHVPFETAISASGGAAGYRWWWWRGQRPMGNYPDPTIARLPRDSEVSDYGVNRPDGTPRPALDEFAGSLAAYTDMDKLTSADYVTHVYDPSPSCSSFIFTSDADSKAIVATTAKKPFRARTICSGKDTTDTPTTGIDGKAYFTGCATGDSDHCSPVVCLDAMFETIQVLDSSGNWADARDGKKVTVSKNAPVKMRVSVGNTGESSWASTATAAGEARIALSGTGLASTRVKIPARVASFDSTSVIEFTAFNALTAATTMSMKMVAEQRAFFGETVKVSLDVAP